MCSCLVFEGGYSQNLRPEVQIRIDSLQVVLQTSREDTSHFKTLFEISSTYYWSYLFPDSVIKYANRLIEKADKPIASLYWKAQGLHMLGLSYMDSDPPEGLKYYFAALKIRKQIQDKRGMSATLHNISNIYSFRLGYYTEALKYNLEALKIREELKDSYLIRASYANIAGNLISQKKYDEALKYYHLIGNMQVKGLTYRDGAGRFMMMGICHCNLGNYNDGFKFLFDALTIHSTEKNKLEIARVLIDIGQCYAKLASGLKPDEANEKFVEALKYLKEGLSAVTSQYVGHRINAYSGLAETYKGLQDYENALLYTNMYQQLVDSLTNKEMQYRIDQLRINYENELITAAEKLEQEKIFLEEKILREKLLAAQKMKQEIRLMEEKTQHELDLKEEKFLKEKSLAEEKVRFENAMTVEKAERRQEQMARRQINNLLFLGLAFVIMISLLTLFLIRQRNFKNRAIERAESIHKMAELELQSLRSQLNPHFMFNSLNAIQELILKEDNDSSHLYLSRFSELLRMLLDNASQPFIPLRKELNFLELYLSLEKLRIPDLRYSLEVAQSIDSNTMLIPNMMLQPYIENALWHGLSSKRGSKNLFIKVYRTENSIVCEVEDNGVGRKMATELKGLYRKEHRSRGMELLSKRFNLISKEYGSEIQTTIEDLHDNGGATGTRVAITVPYLLTKQLQPLYS